MRIRTVLAVVMAIIMFIGCGKVDEETTSSTSDKKEEIAVETEIIDEEDVVSQEENARTAEELVEAVVEDVASESVPVEQVRPEEVQKTETKKATEAPTTTTQVASETITTMPEPEVKVEECEHWYQPVFEEYDIIEHYVYGCNGCGYPLFTLEGNDAVNISDLYFHPSCETDRYDEPCTGGGFHSEWFTSAKCSKCRGDVVKRQCMFSVMGLRCIQNEVLGPYAKTEEGQNPTAYIKSCDCGENLVVKDGVTGKGVLFVTETCCYCGDVINYPQQ